jgi:multidrug efflux pump subunit AcrA (membrane-fusion protein)
LVRLDEITRGEGKVIPSSQTQIVQSEKGGVILDLKVREGDIVNAGDVVAVIDNTQLATNMAELQQRGWLDEAALRACSWSMNFSHWLASFSLASWDWACWNAWVAPR